MKETLEQLKAGRQRLVTKGWVKGVNTHRKENCVLTALPGYAKPVVPDSLLRTENALYNALPVERRRDDGGAVVSLIRYNDAPATALDDILALYDRAIEAEM